MTLQTRLCIEVICRMRHIRSKEYVAICRILRHIAAPFRNDIYGSSEGARVLIVHSMRFVIHCFFNQRHRRVHRVTFLLAQLCRNRDALRKNKQKTRRLNFKETIRTSLSQRGAKVSLKFRGCKKYRDSGRTSVFLVHRHMAVWLYRWPQSVLDLWVPLGTRRSKGRW